MNPNSDKYSIHSISVSDTYSLNPDPDPAKNRNLDQETPESGT